MKIYTKTGDKGETSLIGGQRVKKSHLRLEAYGTLDELNSQLGVCCALLSESSSSRLPELHELKGRVESLQHKLFNIGSLLACEDEKTQARLPSISEEDLSRLESYIDEDSETLAPLKQFILPGGSLPAAQFHLGRTLARRAERQIARLSETTEVPALVLAYINRLSDYLFVLARRTNLLLGHPDIPWSKERG